MDRRAAFFSLAAAVSAILIPVTEDPDRWVPAALAVVYLLLAIASWADHRTRRRVRSQRSRRNRRATNSPGAAESTRPT